MKLTKENYELMMFDLLEGNLSEREEQVILEEIENDPFFAQEWKLFSETVLEPEEIVFTKKDALLKDEKPVIIPLRSRWQIFSYAAAVAAIFVGVFWFAQRAPQGVDVVESSTPDKNHIASKALPDSHSENNKVEASNDHSIEVREEDIRPQELVQTAGQENAERKAAQSPEIKKAVESPQLPEKNNELDHVEQIAGTEKDDQKEKIDLNDPQINLENEMTPEKEIIVDLTPKVPTLKNVNTKGQEEKNDEPLKDILKPEQDLPDYAAAPIVYTGLRAFLRRSANKMITPFRNPKISFDRVESEEKPALNISFTSDAYYASALVHFK